MTDSSTEQQLLTALEDVYDPETGIDIISMGLVYEAKFSAGCAFIKMTLTTPACPMSAALQQGVINRLERVEGVDKVEVELVFDPPWNPSMVSEAARKKMGLG